MKNVLVCYEWFSSIVAFGMERSG